MRPTHRQWSYYLRDVADRAGIEIVAAEVAGLEMDGERWRLAVDPGEPIWADGVVVTGTGPPIRVHGQPHQHPRVLDGRSYWLAAPAHNGHMAMNACVIGSGETAAAAVVNLLDKAHKRSGWESPWPKNPRPPVAHSRRRTECLGLTSRPSASMALKSD